MKQPKCEMYVKFVKYDVIKISHGFFHSHAK